MRFSKLYCFRMLDQLSTFYQMNKSGKMRGVVQLLNFYIFFVSFKVKYIYRNLIVVFYICLFLFLKQMFTKQNSKEKDPKKNKSHFIFTFFRFCLKGKKHKKYQAKCLHASSRNSFFAW